MEQSPTKFYQDQITTYKFKLKSIKRRLFFVGMLRLSAFLGTILLIYLLRLHINIAVISGGMGFALFLYLVSQNANIKLEKKKVEKLLALNVLEVRLLNRETTGVDGGDEYVGEAHYYNQDIDLFGEGSIFQMINRTTTAEGKNTLAGALNSNNIDDIALKQKAIIELSTKSQWRQNYQVTADLIKTQLKSSVLINWMKNYVAKMPNLFRIFPLIFSILSIVLFTAYGIGLLKGELVVIWLFVGITISGIYYKRVSALYSSASQMTDTFAQYAKLLNEIENQVFESELLVEAQNKIKTDNKTASAIFLELSKDLNSLDQRNNVFFALIANGYFLWDVRYSYRIECWIKNYSEFAEKWFETIAQIDAYNSLANYAFNYPSHVFPTVSSNPKTLIDSEALGHPLLQDKQRVTNDFSIRKEDFFIITGANMAGKSTFLRTVALNLVLANVGLPVCAKSFDYSPIKLISSMRTSDSLMNDESYFFSELKRLKFIVDEIKLDRYFIILDEILKGTNSKDKEEGSKKFVEKLVGTDSNGIIATHDLSLCQLEQELPQIENHYFDAEIVNDELFFDYRFKDGICQNMNASFLLRKMEIV